MSGISSNPPHSLTETKRDSLSKAQSDLEILTAKLRDLTRQVIVTEQAIEHLQAQIEKLPLPESSNLRPRVVLDLTKCKWLSSIDFDDLVRNFSTAGQALVRDKMCAAAHQAYLDPIYETEDEKMRAALSVHLNTGVRLGELKYTLWKSE